jgi:hypothetical protein
MSDNGPVTLLSVVGIVARGIFIEAGRCVYISKCSSVYFLFQNNQICYVEVWDRPWLQLREVTNVTCSSTSEPTATASESRSKRVCIAFDVVLCLWEQDVALK